MKEQAQLVNGSWSKTVMAVLMVIIAAILIVVGAVTYNNKLGLVAIPNPNHYTDVADWVQDVKNNVPDSERRHTFVASVYAFLDDNVITDKEYRIIKDNYKDLKQSIALTSIHDNIKLMRAPNEFSLLKPAGDSDVE